MRDIDFLIKSFLNEISIQHEAKLIGDYKVNNRSVVRGHKIFRKLRSAEKVEQLLPELNSKLPQIRSSVAVYCLPIAEEKCLEVLKEIRDNNYSIYSIGAEYAIKNWERKHYFLWDE